MSFLDLKKKGKSTEDFAEDLIKCGRTLYSTSPVTNKSSCFTKSELIQIINLGNLPDEPILSHLFICSDCFNIYQDELSKYQKLKSTPLREKWFMFFTKKLQWQFACLLLVLIGLVALLAIFYNRRETSLDIAENQSERHQSIYPHKNNIENRQVETTTSTDDFKRQPNLNPNITENNKSKNVQMPNNQSNNKKESKLEMPPNIDFELKEDSILRSDRIAKRTDSLILPDKNINLSIKLPNYYENGIYNFSILDVETNVLLTKKVNVNKANLLIKTLDLRKLKKSASKFCLQKEGDIPDCFSIQIK